MTENTTKKSRRLSLNEYLTYVGPFIIFLGMTRLISFYTTFGISIVSYLDFSEIITSFFDIIVFIVLYFLFVSVQSFLMSNKKESDTIKSKQQIIVQEKGFLKLTLLYFNYLKTILFVGLIMTVFFIILHFFHKELTFKMILFMPISFLVICIFIIITLEIERKHKQFNSSKIKKRFIAFALYSLVFTGCIIGYAKLQSYSIKNEKSTYGVTLLFDNDTEFVSDSTSYYIGKTLNYVFIYHEKQNESIVIPMTRIKQLTFPKKTHDGYLDLL